MKDNKNQIAELWEKPGKREQKERGETMSVDWWEKVHDREHDLREYLKSQGLGQEALENVGRMLIDIELDYATASAIESLNRHL